ncbi:MAG: hypothetical protein Ta2F_18590 [Termitinemataceae bacterium]|nr:MAG: hypothetical protein Ta2F_18590 [Termitinemataceae bacterium]
MKTTKKWSKILLKLMSAIMLSFLFFACPVKTDDKPDENEESSGKKITVTGITGITGTVQIALVDEIAQNANCACAGKTTINGGTATFTLKKATTMATLAENGLGDEDYTGTGSYYIFFWNNIDGTFEHQPLKHSTNEINISEANTSISYTDLVFSE